MNSTSVTNSRCADTVASALLVLITKYGNTAKVVEAIAKEASNGKK